MKQLPGLDASFLHLETPQMPMHVGALHLLELPAGYDGDYVSDLREHMRARMPLLPALRRRLVSMPLGLSNPGWVDADPTNNVLPSDRHITVAWGRDFSDVSPLRGVVIGGGSSSLGVSVDVARLAEPAPV